MSRQTAAIVIASALSLASSPSIARGLDANSGTHFVKVSFESSRLSQRQLEKLAPGVRVIALAKTGLNGRDAFLQVPEAAIGKIKKSLAGNTQVWTRGEISVQYEVRSGDSYVQYALASLPVQELKRLQPKSLFAGFAKPQKDLLHVALERNTPMSGWSPSSSPKVLLGAVNSQVKCSVRLATIPAL
jgi:hypothetical protein